MEIKNSDIRIEQMVIAGSGMVTVMDGVSRGGVGNGYNSRALGDWNRSIKFGQLNVQGSSIFLDKLANIVIDNGIYIMLQEPYLIRGLIPYNEGIIIHKEIQKL